MMSLSNVLKSNFMKMQYTFLLLIPLLTTACRPTKDNHPPIADRNASSATLALYSKMKIFQEKGFMIGHQDDMAYGVKWIAPNGKSDVYDVCSDYPAVFGWDLGHLELGTAWNLDSVPFASMIEFAIEVHKLGGINTFSWHCDNPLTGGNTWDTKTPGVVRSILPGGTKHEEYKIWLDKLAAFFSSLKDDQGNCIPVIFRPFHEQSGSWFWWGREHCSSDEFIQLWQLTFKYLTETKQIHNLIFAFSPAGDYQPRSPFTDRYPGNDYVDVVGFDIYQGTDQENKAFVEKFTTGIKTLLEFAEINNKIPAITEMGFEQIPYPTWWSEVVYPVLKEYQVSYALFWRNAANRPNHYYVPYPGQVSEADFVHFYKLPETLFLQDLREK